MAISFKSQDYPNIEAFDLHYLRREGDLHCFPENSLLPLKGKVEALEFLKEVLDNKKKRPGRDRLIAVAATIGALAVVGALIVGTLYIYHPKMMLAPLNQSRKILGGFLIAAAVGTAIGIGETYNYIWSDDKKGVLPQVYLLSPVINALFGSFVPVTMTFGNQKRIGNKITKLEKEIEADREKVKTYATSHAEILTTLFEKLNEAVGHVEKGNQLLKDPELSYNLSKLKKAVKVLEFIRR
jgi:hypothetical protein